MALLNILHHPDPRLRTKATPVTIFDESLAKLADDMLETMYAAPGIGLAATQVNVHKRLIVVDVSEEHDSPHVLVNPQLELLSGKVTTDEGCLSVPGVYEKVDRAEVINVTARDIHTANHATLPPMDFWLFVFNTSATILKANCLLTICPASSATESTKNCANLLNLAVNA